MKTDTPNKCQRCDAHPVPRSMSYFNPDMCCSSCLDNERKHPMFEKAKAREEAEMQAKYSKGLECWFEGIGLPDNGYQVTQADATEYLSKDRLAFFTRNIEWQIDDLAVGQSRIVGDMTILRLF